MVDDRIGRADRGAYASACLLIHMVGDNYWTSVGVEIVEGDPARSNDTSRSLVLHFAQRYCKEYMEQGSKQADFALYAAASYIGAFLECVARSGDSRADDEFTVPGDFCASSSYCCS